MTKNYLIASFKTIFIVLLLSTTFANSKTIESDKDDMKTGYITEIVRSLVKGDSMFLHNDNSPKVLNITDDTVNAIFRVAQSGVKMDYTIYGDSVQGLPITIDTTGLQVLVPELEAKYENNQKMGLRVYCTPGTHPSPAVKTDIDGTRINLNFGMDFLVINNQGVYDLVLSIDVHAFTRLVFIQHHGKLDVHIAGIEVESITTKTDLLSVDTERMKSSFEAFFTVAIEAMKAKTYGVDILTQINKLADTSFTAFSVIPDSNYFVITLKYI